MKAKRYMLRPRKPAEAFRDRRGIAYDLRTTLLPARMDQWPKYPPRVKADKDGTQRTFHEDFAGTPCWLCGDARERHELHHLAAGSRGRSMERELYVWLCATCHREIEPGDLSVLLWAKWKWDHAHCDWELLMVRHGQRFDFELEAPEWYAQNHLIEGANA